MIYLARHGETTWNLAGRYQGRQESDLSPLGLRQSAALANYFAERLVRGETTPRSVLSSPLRRCVETARVSAEALGLEVETDERLIEIAHGTWEGRLRDEIAAGDPARYAAWRNDPAGVAFEGGESLAEVLRRWNRLVPELARAPHDVLVVTHDAVIRVGLLAARERPLAEFWQTRVENGAFARLAAREGKLAVVEECFTDHLAGARAPLDGQAL